ncbi:DUF192 domain-containing protein [Qipengyuania sp. ASV99]|uniref:DUF192 domain-containing protein n=1 Tax=Qipengyuania sp. ASV99 TaxID=3399681 RepID=UPI003A4C6643
MGKWVSMFAALILAACSAADGSSANAQVTRAEDKSAGQAAIVTTERAVPTEHPESGLQLITVTVHTGDEQIGFLTELADTNEAQARGLMFRTELDDFAAMLFPSYTPQVRSFWMKNTPLPLDIIFIGPDNRIANIAKGVPYSTDSVASDGLAIAVFEIRGGRSEELGIKPGDLVEFTLPQ